MSSIDQQCIIYDSSIIFVGGIIDNGINILIFSTVRTTPCTFYFLVASIYNIVYIYGIDFSSMSISWCKIRQFLIVILSLITSTCSCLATIDQFLATSSNIFLGILSKIV